MSSEDEHALTEPRSTFPYEVEDEDDQTMPFRACTRIGYDRDLTTGKLAPGLTVGALREHYGVSLASVAQ